MLLEAAVNVGLSPIEWRDWVKHPASQEVLRVLQAEREEWVRRLVEGEVINMEPGTEIRETAHAVGLIRGLDALLMGIEEKLQEQWAEEQEKLNKGG